MRYLILLLLPFALFAKPSGLEVHKGSASYSSASAIKTSDRAILHWKDFSIGKGKKFRFVQPSSKSAVLNRVTGKEASHLLGSLKSNGTVFLINPNGVYIGGDAKIQTAGFLASTADITDANFLNGEDYHFTDLGEGKIINEGRIECPKGEIYLIAKEVTNKGALSADHVGLAAATEVLIRPTRNPKVMIRIPLEEGSIENSGVIDALTTELKTSSPYEKAINQRGHVGGKYIHLVATEGGTVVDGSLQAKEVRVLGKEVHLTDKAFIDVGEGTALIGGDYQGNNPEILNANRLTMDPGAEILAEGKVGGKVILWSEDATHFFGNISAEAVGDGGFVEVSTRGHDYLFRGTVNTLSKQGKPGMLLLDPSDITVSGAPTDNPFDPPTTYNPAGVASAILNAGDLSTALGTSPITIATSAGVGGTGLVTFSTGFSWTSGTLLTVTSSNILVSAGVTIDASAGSGGSVTFTADGLSGTSIIGIDILGSILTTGPITLTGTGGAAGSLSTGVHLGSAGVVTAGGAISVTGTAGGTVSPTAHGIEIEGDLESTGSTVTMVGDAPTGGASGMNGILVAGTGSVMAAGAITATGTIGPISGSSARGIFIAVSGVVESTGGSVSLTGLSEGTSSPSAGTTISGMVTAATDVILSGTGSPDGEDFDHGVSVEGAGATVTATSGDITVTTAISGGGGDGFECNGLRIATGGKFSAPSGAVTALGAVGGFLPGGGGENAGVFLSGTDTIIAGGAIILSATGRGEDPDNYGIQLSAAEITGSAVSLTGTSIGEGEANSGIFIDGATMVTSTSTITMNGTGSSSGTNSNRGILFEGGTISGTGAVTLVGEGRGTTDDNFGIEVDSDISGGTISLTGSSSGAGADNVGVVLTDGIFSASGNITVTGTGSSSGTTDNVGVRIESDAVMTSTGGNVLFTGTAGSGTTAGFRLIDEGNLTSTGPGSLTVRTFSDIVLISTEIDPMFITAVGNVTLNAATNITLTAGTSDVTVSSTGGTVTAFAGSDITMTSTAPEIASFTAPGDVTLIVDNDFPTPPASGTGALTKDADSTIISTGGAVRIFTSRRSLNTIDGEINGTTFVPGPFLVDSATEQWGVYFPSSFGGTPFTIFYKEGFVSPPVAAAATFFQDVAANLTQLSDLLPVLHAPRWNYPFPPYHFNVCSEETCSPDFNPYGSFIFEDDLWWIGERP